MGAPVVVVVEREEDVGKFGDWKVVEEVVVVEEKVVETTVAATPTPASVVPPTPAAVVTTSTPVAPSDITTEVVTSPMLESLRNVQAEYAKKYGTTGFNN